MTKLPPMHPGEVLREEFMKSRMQFWRSTADRCGIDYNTFTALLEERTSVTPDIAMRLSHCFGGNSAFWLNLQRGFDEHNIQTE